MFTATMLYCTQEEFHTMPGLGKCTSMSNKCRHKPLGRWEANPGFWAVPPLKIELTLAADPGLIWTMLPWGMVGVLAELMRGREEGVEMAGVEIILAIDLGISMPVVAESKAKINMAALVVEKF